MKPLFLILLVLLSVYCVIADDGDPVGDDSTTSEAAEIKAEEKKEAAEVRPEDEVQQPTNFETKLISLGDRRHAAQLFAEMEKGWEGMEPQSITGRRKPLSDMPPTPYVPEPHAKFLFSTLDPMETPASIKKQESDMQKLQFFKMPYHPLRTEDGVPNEEPWYKATLPQFPSAYNPQEAAKTRAERKKEKEMNPTKEYFDEGAHRDATDLNGNPFQATPVLPPQSEAQFKRQEEQVRNKVHPRLLSKYAPFDGTVAWHPTDWPTHYTANPSGGPINNAADEAAALSTAASTSGSTAAGEEARFKQLQDLKTVARFKNARRAPSLSPTIPSFGSIAETLLLEVDSKLSTRAQVKTQLPDQGGLNLEDGDSRHPLMGLPPKMVEREGAYDEAEIVQSKPILNSMSTDPSELLNDPRLPYLYGEKFLPDEADVKVLPGPGPEDTLPDPRPTNPPREPIGEKFKNRGSSPGFMQPGIPMEKYEAKKLGEGAKNMYPTAYSETAVVPKYNGVWPNNFPVDMHYPNTAFLQTEEMLKTSNPRNPLKELQTQPLSSLQEVLEAPRRSASLFDALSGYSSLQPLPRDSLRVQRRVSLFPEVTTSPVDSLSPSFLEQEAKAQDEVILVDDGSTISTPSASTVTPITPAVTNATPNPLLASTPLPKKQAETPFVHLLEAKRASEEAKKKNLLVEPTLDIVPDTGTMEPGQLWWENPIAVQKNLEMDPKYPKWVAMMKEILEYNKAAKVHKAATASFLQQQQSKVDEAKALQVSDANSGPSPKIAVAIEEAKRSKHPEVAQRLLEAWKKEEASAEALLKPPAELSAGAKSLLELPSQKFDRNVEAWKRQGTPAAPGRAAEAPRHPASLVETMSTAVMDQPARPAQSFIPPPFMSFNDDSADVRAPVAPPTAPTIRQNSGWLGTVGHGIPSVLLVG